MTDKGQETHGTPSHLLTQQERWELQRAFYEAGVMPALYDALVIAKESGLPPPDWVVEESLMVVGDRLKLGFTTGKGAIGNELPKYQAAMKHYRRWQAVKKLRDKGTAWMEVYDEAEKLL